VPAPKAEQIDSTETAEGQSGRGLLDLTAREDAAPIRELRLGFDSHRRGGCPNLHALTTTCGWSVPSTATGGSREMVPRCRGSPSRDIFAPMARNVVRPGQLKTRLPKEFERRVNEPSTRLEALRELFTEHDVDARGGYATRPRS